MLPRGPARRVRGSEPCGGSRACYGAGENAANAVPVRAFGKPSRKKALHRAFYEAAPRVNVSSTSLVVLCRSCRSRPRATSGASFYPRSNEWRHAGRRRTGGIGWGGTPSICRCSLRHQAPRRVSRPVRVILAAARAFGRVPRSLCRRAEAGRLVDARIAPHGVENPREPPREGHHRAQLAAPLRPPPPPLPQRGPHRRPTPPEGPRGLGEQPPHAAVARLRERPATLLL